jgi:hypothetical protein
MTVFALLRLSCCVALIGGLAGCGSDPAQTGTAARLTAAAGPMFSSLFGRSKPATGGIGLTRAHLAKFNTPVDLVTIESRKAQGIIFKVAANRDVETWSSADQKTLSFRDGVIVATRGLGDDLMSASAPRLAQLRAAAASYTRVHTVLTGEDKPLSLRYECTTSKAAPQAITVVEKSYNTQVTSETCVGPKGGFTNQYWIEPNGNLRKSRQWISDTVKYVVIEHLKE